MYPLYHFQQAVKGSILATLQIYQDMIMLSGTDTRPSRAPNKTRAGMATYSHRFARYRRDSLKGCMSSSSSVTYSTRAYVQGRMHISSQFEITSLGARTSAPPATRHPPTHIPGWRQQHPVATTPWHAVSCNGTLARCFTESSESLAQDTGRTRHRSCSCMRQDTGRLGRHRSCSCMHTHPCHIPTRPTHATYAPCPCRFHATRRRT